MLALLGHWSLHSLGPIGTGEANAPLDLAQLVLCGVKVVLDTSGDIAKELAPRRLKALLQVVESGEQVEVRGQFGCGSGRLGGQQQQERCQRALGREQ